MHISPEYGRLSGMHTGLRVLVTGSSKGIGRQIALHFGRRQARIAVNGRDPDNLRRAVESLRAEGIEAHPVQGDITDPRQAAAIVDGAVQALGGLDVLVNNAGLAMRGRFDAVEPEVWSKVVTTNILGTAFVTRASIPFITASQGSIVVISSLVGIWGFPLVSAYSASKMALNGMVESMRAELHGSRVHLGLLYAGLTQNDDDKHILDTDGSPLPLAARTGGMSQSSVAAAVYRMVRRRRKAMVLTAGGRVIAVLAVVAPWLIRVSLALIPGRVNETAK